jgi:hypothetical protein
VTSIENPSDVDWSNLEHAYGSAENVPRLLTTLAEGSRAERAEALAELRHTIHHQFSRYSASAAAVPFLIELIGDPARDDRPALLSLLLGVAVGEPDPYEGYDVREWTMPAASKACYQAVVAFLPKVLALLGDADDSVRGAAPYALSQLADHANDIAPRLRRDISTEANAVVRASLVLALRLLGRHAKASSDEATLDAIVARGKAGDVDAVAAALARIALFGRDGKAEALLSAARGIKTPAGFVWGELSTFVDRTLGAIELERPLEELVAWLERPRVDGDPLNTQPVLPHVLEVEVPPHGGSYRLAHEITALARRALIAGLRRTDQFDRAADPWLLRRGIPPVLSLPFWLGIEAPRLLEREVPGEPSWPLWKWLQSASCEEVTYAQAAAAVARALDETERVQLMSTSQFDWEYDIRGGIPIFFKDYLAQDRALSRVQQLEATILATCQPATIEAEATRLCAQPMEGHFTYRMAVLAALARHRGGKGLDQTHLALWDARGGGVLLREILAAIPDIATRQPLVLACPFFVSSATIVTSDGGRSRVPYLDEAHFGVADLCPTAAVADHFVTAILRTKHDEEFPREQLVALARRVGDVLRQPVARALEDPANKGFHGRSMLVEILAGLGAKESLPYVAELAASRKAADKKSAARCISLLTARGVDVSAFAPKPAKAKAARSKKS